MSDLALPPPVLELRSLRAGYGRIEVLHGIDLAVPGGTLLGLLGPNGAGKTTTVEICEGYRHADAGSVRVLGLDPATQHDELTPRIGVMLQSGGVYPGARAIEMLHLVASFAADPLPVRRPPARAGRHALARPRAPWPGRGSRPRVRRRPRSA